MEGGRLGRVVGLMVVLGLLGFPALTCLPGALIVGEGEGWVFETFPLDSNFSLASS